MCLWILRHSSLGFTVLSISSKFSPSFLALLKGVNLVLNPLQLLSFLKAIVQPSFNKLFNCVFLFIEINCCSHILSLSVQRSPTNNFWKSNLLQNCLLFSKNCPPLPSFLMLFTPSPLPKMSRCSGSVFSLWQHSWNMLFLQVVNREVPGITAA